MKRGSTRVPILAVLALLAACGGGTAAPDAGGPGDAGDQDVGADESPVDAAVDVATDRPTDLPPDLPRDVPPDSAFPDVPADAPRDTPADAPPDAPADVPHDTPTDVPADVPADVPPDAPADVPADPGPPDPGPDAGPVTVQVRPAVAADVVASYLMNASPAAWNLFGGDALPLGRHFDADHVAYHSAVRFPGVAVPAGATVQSAVLSFLPTNEVDSSNILWLQVSAEQAADSAPLSLSDYDAGRPDQRLRTDARIPEWAIRCRADCTDLNEYDCPQRQRDCWDRTVRYACPKDLKALVQEVVDLPGWAAGNALTVFLDVNVPRDYVDRDTGARHVTGVDPARDASTRPMLEITYR